MVITSESLLVGLYNHASDVQKRELLIRRSPSRDGSTTSAATKKETIASRLSRADSWLAIPPSSRDLAEIMIHLLGGNITISNQLTKEIAEELKQSNVAFEDFSVFIVNLLGGNEASIMLLDGLGLIVNFVNEVKKHRHSVTYLELCHAFAKASEGSGMGGHLDSGNTSSVRLSAFIIAELPNIKTFLAKYKMGFGEYSELLRQIIRPNYLQSPGINSQIDFNGFKLNLDFVSDPE